MSTKIKSTSIHLPPAVLAEVDQHLAARANHDPVLRPSRSAWIAQAIRAALDAARTSTASPTASPNT